MIARAGELDLLLHHASLVLRGILHSMDEHDGLGRRMLVEVEVLAVGWRGPKRMASAQMYEDCIAAAEEVVAASVLE